MRGALGPDRQLFQAFPLGGVITSLALAAGVWREFVPADSSADLYWVETPLLASGTIIHTNSASVPGLVDGAAVDAAHRGVSVRLPPDGADVYGFDREADGGVRFFFAVVDGDGSATALKLMQASR